MKKSIVTVIGILCFTGLGLFALSKGIDGAILITCAGGIAGALGFTIGKKT